MGPWVVAPVRVDMLLQELIGDEVDGLEGNVHGQLRGVTPVEGPQALSPPNCPDAAEGRPVGRVVHLHALLHNCRRGRRAQWTGNQSVGSWLVWPHPRSEINGKPSHKEKQASLDMLVTGHRDLAHTAPAWDPGGSAPGNPNPAPGRWLFPELSLASILFKVVPKPGHHFELESLP